MKTLRIRSENFCGMNYSVGVYHIYNDLYPTMAIIEYEFGLSIV
jgi:hypothetical protein